jgi:pectate disaccharide-lyase
MNSKGMQQKANSKGQLFRQATPDNQEGFGIMARDAIVKDSDATVFPSNMALVGGYRGNIQSVFPFRSWRCHGGFLQVRRGAGE